MTTVFLDAVSKPCYKIVHDTGQQLTIDRTNGFFQIIRRTGFVSVNTRFQITPHPPKKNHTLKDRDSEEATAKSPKREMRVAGKHVSNSGHWLICSVRCSTILFKPHIGTVPSSSAHSPTPPPPPFSGLPTEYYPFKTCQFPVGHSVYCFDGLLNKYICLQTRCHSTNST